MLSFTMLWCNDSLRNLASPQLEMSTRRRKREAFELHPPKKKGGWVVNFPKQVCSLYVVIIMAAFWRVNMFHPHPHIPIPIRPPIPIPISINHHISLSWHSDQQLIFGCHTPTGHFGRPPHSLDPRPMQPVGCRAATILSPFLRLFGQMASCSATSSAKKWQFPTLILKCHLNDNKILIHVYCIYIYFCSLVSCPDFLTITWPARNPFSISHVLFATWRRTNDINNKDSYSMLRP